MRELTWSDNAVNNLKRLRAFIIRENAAAAQRAANAIISATKQLLTTPNIGKPLEDLPGYRDYFIRFGATGYILRYRMLDESIYILNVRHYREVDFKLRPERIDLTLEQS